MQGKCRAIGVSNYLERHLREILDDPSGSRTAPMLNQCEFSPVCQQHALRRFCAANGIAWMGHTPFGGRGAPLLRDGRLQQSCRRLGKAPSQLVLAWYRHHRAVAIPKTQSDRRMRCGLQGPLLLCISKRTPPTCAT